MKKRQISQKVLLISVGIIAFVLAVSTLLSNGMRTQSTTTTIIIERCIGEDESVDILLEENWNKECCEGLTKSNVCSYDVSVGDKCYEPPTDAIPVGCIYLGCSNCGDDVCKDNEDVCSCPQDCIAVKEPDYKTVQNFCDEGYEQYCKDVPEGEKTDLCKLCE